MSESTTHLDSETFHNFVAGNERPVIVDFYADWCGPCHALAPVLASVADAYADRIDVVKVDVDRSPELAADFGIRSIPTLIAFRGGDVSGQHIGAATEGQLRHFVEDQLQ